MNFQGKMLGAYHDSKHSYKTTVYPLPHDNFPYTISAALISVDLLNSFLLKVIFQHHSNCQ
ncbi:hypothetical protein MLOOGBEN_22065 [Bacillus sp. EB106-08-02-XG196]|nr:hypothetical protein [Bacillus sp. EB106-08-02-XG196]